VRSEEGRTGRSAAYGAAAAVFATGAFTTWPVAVAPKSTFPIWPAYLFGGLALLALYMCFATIFGWWPTSRSGRRSEEARSEPSAREGDADSGEAGTSAPSTTSDRAGAPAGPPQEFIGRHDDLANLLNALRDSQIPLVTLKGMGGIGKTALAEEAVRIIGTEVLFSAIFWHSTQAEKFVGDGVVRTEVADYTFEALLDDLLRHSQLPWSADAPVISKEKIVKGWLEDSSRRVLIVLDNLETVPERDALIGALLQILGWGKILVTSRYSVLPSRAFTLELEGLSPQDTVTFLTWTAQRQNNKNLLSAGLDVMARIHDAVPLENRILTLTWAFSDFTRLARIR
jgi:hypothetical protein